MLVNPIKTCHPGVIVYLICKYSNLFQRKKAKQSPNNTYLHCLPLGYEVVTVDLVSYFFQKLQNDTSYTFTKVKSLKVEQIANILKEDLRHTTIFKMAAETLASQHGVARWFPGT